jgi:hypothetical protein
MICDDYHSLHWMIHFCWLAETKTTHSHWQHVHIAFGFGAMTAETRYSRINVIQLWLCFCHDRMWAYPFTQHWTHDQIFWPRAHTHCAPKKIVVVSSCYSCHWSRSRSRIICHDSWGIIYGVLRVLSIIWRSEYCYIWIIVMCTMCFISHFPSILVVLAFLCFTCILLRQEALRSWTVNVHANSSQYCIITYVSACVCTHQELSVCLHVSRFYYTCSHGHLVPER